MFLKEEQAAIGIFYLLYWGHAYYFSSKIKNQCVLY